MFLPVAVLCGFMLVIYSCWVFSTGFVARISFRLWCYVWSLVASSSQVEVGFLSVRFWKSWLMALRAIGVVGFYGF
jgi:hypothetical protein